MKYLITLAYFRNPCRDLYAAYAYTIPYGKINFWAMHDLTGDTHNARDSRVTL